MKTFSLYNSLTGRVEPLEPRTPGKLTFYACGPTVYSYAHLGNFRSFLTADLIVRTARAIGWDVAFVSNITDVGHLTEDDVADAHGEDKMMRALRSKEGRHFATIWDLARYYADTFLEDWAVLNLVEPAVRPRATDHVTQQIEAIEKLVQQGAAYETSLGVYFSAQSSATYGLLSGNLAPWKLAGSREIVTDRHKRDPRDFALWKKDHHHLMRWHSPFGWGYPGWHIECSTMAMKYLGETLDIHSGGIDNKFPHHECEMAQSERLTGKPFVGHWVHTGSLNVDGKRMSKRSGNFVTVRDMLYGGPARGNYLLDPGGIRWALTSARYREPFNFTRDHARACGTTLIQRVRRAQDMVRIALREPRPGEDCLGPALESIYGEILDAMLDDLNTSVAYALLLKGAGLIGEQRGGLNSASARSGEIWFEKINKLLGVLWNEHPMFTASSPDTELRKAKVESLVAERDRARRNHDFVRADEIRDKLLEMGIQLEDSALGTVWKTMS